MGTLTAKGEATRLRILDATADLVRRRGAEVVGLDDVLAATSTSKGQLFHYFPDGRAQLLLEVARVEADAVLSDQEPHLTSLGDAESWATWRDAVVKRYRDQGDACPLTALTRQLGPGVSTTRPVVQQMLATWHQRLADGARRAGSSDPDRVAATVLAAVQGGASLRLSTGSMRYLEDALDAALESAGLTNASSDRSR